MKKLAIIITVLLSLIGCASGNRNQEIPIHALSIGMNKDGVVEKLGKPHRVVSSDMVENINRQVWIYQKDNLIWISGNAFLGGRTRNDQVTYLLYFADEKLVGWKDNDFKTATKPENIYELRK